MIGDTSNERRWVFIKFMVPAVLNNLTRMLTESINLIFIGKVKNEAKIIAGIGVGNMI